MLPEKTAAGRMLRDIRWLQFFCEGKRHSGWIARAGIYAVYFSCPGRYLCCLFFLPGPVFVLLIFFMGQYLCCLFFLPGLFFLLLFICFLCQVGHLLYPVPFFG